MSEAFTVELRVYESAGYTKQQVLSVLEAVFESAEEDGSCYLYPRESKIMQQTILEVTGVKRDSTPRPIISGDLYDRLMELAVKNGILLPEE